MDQVLLKRSLFSFCLARFNDYCQLIKLRLTLLVVFSAGIGFVIGGSISVISPQFILLLLSGFFVTGAANGINQIIERNLDKLMTRTLNRPVATGRLSIIESTIVVILMGLLGVFLLGYYFNNVTALIGISSLLIYGFVYTPLKRVTPLAVVAGAIPGAVPPTIGYIAVTGEFDMICLILFIIQFIWQFPHFWAVAWILNDEYNKAGFFLLPTRKGRDKRTAVFIFTSTLLLVGLSIYLLFVGFSNPFTAILITILSLHFSYQSYKLMATNSLKEARQLMFGSFYYLPLVQILLVIGKMF